MSFALKSFFLLTFATFLAFDSANANNGMVNYDRFKIFRITLQTDEDLAALEYLKTYGIKPMMNIRKKTEILVPPNQLKLALDVLQQSAIYYEEVISDVGGLIRSNKQKNKPMKNGKIYWDQYYTLEEIYEFLGTQVINNTSAAEVVLENIGLTSEGRNITIIKISKFGFTKPAIWIDANMHAREWITGAVATYIIDQLINNMSPEIQSLSVDFDFYILPIANPDGYEYSHVADRLWRKTRSKSNSTLGCMGTDPNRNYDAFWTEIGGASPDPCSNSYRGSQAFSEPETNATANFLKSIETRLVLYLSLHSSGQYILIPTGFGPINPIPDNDEYMRMANNAALAHLVPFGTNFTVGNIVDLLYNATGSSMDWAYQNMNNLKLAVTYELRDKGQYGHLLPPDQILPSCEEFMEGFKVLLNEIKTTTPVTTTTTPPTPSTTTPPTPSTTTFPTPSTTTAPTPSTTTPSTVAP